MASTELVYFSDTYLFEHSGAAVIAAGEADSKKFVILDKTIFYPQGGGQPADTGAIASADGNVVFNVSDVRMKDGVVLHYGEYSNADGVARPFQPSSTVKQIVDKEKRLLHARLHSAGHLIDVAVKALMPKLEPGKGYHFPKGAYVEYEGEVTEDQKKTAKEMIQQEMDKLIEQGIATDVQMVPLSKVGDLCGGWVPSYLTDPSKDYRIVTVGGLGCPCGGTHVGQTGEMKGLVITGVKFPKGKMRVSYDIK